MENGNNNNNKNKIILATLVVVLIAGVSISLYMKRPAGTSSVNEQAQDHSKPNTGGQAPVAAVETKPNTGGAASETPSASSPHSVPAPVAEEPACKIVKMKPQDGKGTYRKNLLFIDSAVNAKSICVKVDGTAVKFDLFQKKSNQILIGGVRGPKTEITIRFCREKNLCKEDCKIPRDEFMDALGASDDKADSAARWDDGKESDTEKQVAKQMGVFKDDLKAIEAKAMSQMSKWDAKESAPACVGTGSVAKQ